MPEGNNKTDISVTINSVAQDKLYSIDITDAILKVADEKILPFVAEGIGSIGISLSGKSAGKYKPVIAWKSIEELKNTLNRMVDMSTTNSTQNKAMKQTISDAIAKLTN